MRFFALVILLVCSYSMQAQNCDSLVSTYVNTENKKELNGYNIRIDSLNLDIWPVKDSTGLWLHGSMLSFVFTEGWQERIYTITFSDKSEYKYKQPFLVVGALDLFILLSGERDYYPVTKNGTMLKKAKGDTTLLNKLLSLPVKSIQIQSALWITEGDYIHLEQKMRPIYTINLPESDAIKLMHSVQCLVKRKWQ